MTLAKLLFPGGGVSNIGRLDNSFSQKKNSNRIFRSKFPHILYLVGITYLPSRSEKEPALNSKLTGPVVVLLLMIMM